MKDSIYTIPISEVFEPRQGCPLCALYRTLETRWVEYITGAAMMEPDVREETNKQGFCSQHFSMMLGQRNRLSVALILQTRLAWLDDHLEEGKARGGMFAWAKQAPSAGESCFVCSKIDGEFERIAGNIATVWGREADFRKLYGEQEHLCHPHYRLLVRAAEGALRRDQLGEFSAVTAGLARKGLRAVKEDIDAFCRLFDYRSAGAAQPEEAVSTSVERAIAYLTGQPGEDAKK